jgi:RNA polymerase sporulation-specific sigma factor
MTMNPLDDEQTDAEYALPPEDEPEEQPELTWDETLKLRFGDKSDETIVAMAQNGDRVALEFLLSKYKNFVRSKARSYFLIGADHEDIVQEGMIGLFKSVRDYQLERLSSFRAFAELCITRQIITAIKTATRQKHLPLNSYVSLNKPIYDEESDRTLMDVIVEGHAQNPEELIIGREDILSIRDQVGSVLSSLEQDVLSAYLDGKSYQEIADKLGRHVKSIDNALQRVKRKLEKYLQEMRLHDDD